MCCAFQRFLDLFAAAENEQFRPKGGLSPDAKLSLTLWTLANQECFRQIGDRFGLSRGYANYIFTQSCQLISKLARTEGIIRWPLEHEMMNLAEKVKFPGAFAFVDGSHIPIKTPLNDTDSYINRKSFASIVLQGVCTFDLKFIDISTWWPGSMHDARIYRRSHLCTVINDDKFPKDLHILGDSAYPLETSLLVPFRDNGHLTDKQKKFNFVLSSSRSAVERSFALLKGKFRRLKYLDINNLSLVPDIVIGACTLHNFILQNESSCDDEFDYNVSNDCNSPNSVSTAELTAGNSAVQKRNEIAEKL